MRGRPNVPADVWDRIERRGDDECWPWTAARNRKGYGQMRLNRRQVPAHRIAYAVATGQEPGDLCVLHRCDNPPCCNPAHLFLGTRADNNRDCREKGRHPHGSTHHASKLTTEAVVEIRRRRARGEQGIALASEFGVTPQAISYIVNREVWSHV